MTNALDHEGRKSITHTSDDLDVVEYLGVSRFSSGPMWHAALQRWKDFRELMERADELREKGDRLRIGELLELLEDMPMVEEDVAYAEDMA